MRKVFSIIFFILSIASYDTKSFSDIKVKIIKKQNIEVIKFQMPDQKFPGKDDVLAQIHFPSNINSNTVFAIFPEIVPFLIKFINIAKFLALTGL